MSLKNLKDSELNKLLDEVALDLNKAFGEVQNKLAKKEEVAKEEVQKDEVPPKGPEESSPVAEGSDAPPAAPPADDGSAPPAPGADAGGAPADPAMDQGAALTPEALQAEYEKLPPEELQMHMAACQAAMAKLSGGMGAPDAGMGAPPAPEAAAPAPQAPAPLAQSEKKVEAETLVKTESNEKLSKAEAEVASLKEDVEILAKTLKTIIETPVRKAITSIADLPKSEEEVNEESYKSLAPDQFWNKLAEVSKRTDLKKSEKKLILDIYAKTVQPEVAAKQLAKLFKAE